MEPPQKPRLNATKIEKRNIKYNLMNTKKPIERSTTYIHELKTTI